MYTPARVWSQQNQDSPFRTGVCTSWSATGPETAADGRTHFGISRLRYEAVPRGQRFTSASGLQRRRPGYFAAARLRP